MSLKEEIKQILPYMNSFKDGVFFSEENTIDEIISKIEKRIDSMIADLPEYKVFDMELLFKVKEILK